MTCVVLLNKPYGFLSQFSAEGRWRGLADLVPVPGVHAAGRLDADSEGLLVLTNDGALQHRLADPRKKTAKVYWAQVEGIPDPGALAQLQRGVCLGDFVTRPCTARPIESPPGLWERDPPIRARRSIPTSWLEIVLREGRNRQVRRMCAAVGFPVLRLVRYAVGPYTLDGIAPGEWRMIEESDAGVEPVRGSGERRRMAPRRCKH